MIESRIKNELTLKRYRRIKRNKVGVLSIWIVGLFVLLSLLAEFWVNSKPIAMSYQGKLYFPVVVDYHPTVFDREDIFVMDYRSLQFSSQDWVIWPVVQWDPFESNKEVQSYPSPPTKINPLGTDDRGRDVLARLVYGFRYSLGYAIGVWFLAYLIGTLVGSVQGYLGGLVDLVGSRIVELIEMIPTLLLLITLISIFSPGITLLVIFTVLFDWTFIYHHMRAQFLQLRKRDYVDAARAIGASHWRIVIKHIMPNALTPLVTFSPFAIASNISGLAVLDYLGLGLPAPTPSWGELISQAQKYFSIAEWLVWGPSIALLITMVCLINIGLAVRDAYDSTK